MPLIFFKVRLEVHGDMVTSKGIETVKWDRTYNVRASSLKRAEQIVRSDVPSGLKVDVCKARESNEEEFKGQTDFSE